jgi:uncharacterized glyoxalase superfamily protein PhnB
MGDEPMLYQLNLVVRDMNATLAFYRLVGLAIDVTPSGHHASARLPGGLLVEWDTAEFAKRWDSGWHDAGSGDTVIGFSVESRDAVDEMYARLTGAGYRPQQPPYDAFWGSRYAIVEDPDGRPVGFMSPEDDSKKSWPPGVPASS